MKLVTLLSILLLAAFAFLLGFALVLLLPAVFLTWLREWLYRLREPDEEDPTPLLKAIEREQWINEIEQQLAERSNDA